MVVRMIESLVLGVHLVSVHMPAEPHHNNVNAGIYVRADGWTAGTYRNTLRRQSVYFGRQFDVGFVSLGVGLISGYRKECAGSACYGETAHRWSPMLAPSVALPRVAGIVPRVWVIPGFANSASVVHLSVEVAL